MLDELKQQFYDVMYKYNKPFTETGVMANLTRWQQNKAPLLELLRRHPNWREEELAIVFDVTEQREIDRDVVDQCRFELEELVAEYLPDDDTRRLDFHSALYAATQDYARVPDEVRLEEIRRYGHIKCAPGQKASRIINRLCLHLGVEQYETTRMFGEPGHQEPRTIRPYNAIFARLADALNPVEIHKRAVLSVHPCDFLEMSNTDSTWRSCHSLDHGSYRAGCLSYMGDDVSMIFFTVDEDCTANFHKAPRLTRQLFFYQEGLLLQSKLYPNSSEDFSALNRSIVQKAISLCLDVPNLWVTKHERDEIKDFFETGKDTQHYPDYKYGAPQLSFLKGQDAYPKLVIGRPALCTCCGTPRKADDEGLKCDACPETTICQGCGESVSFYDVHRIGGKVYCGNCVTVCAGCHKEFMGPSFPAYNRRGELKRVCSDCYNDAASVCQGCGIRTICKSVRGVQHCPYIVHNLMAA